MDRILKFCQVGVCAYQSEYNSFLACWFSFRLDSCYFCFTKLGALPSQLVCSEHIVLDFSQEFCFVIAVLCGLVAYTVGYPSLCDLYLRRDLVHIATIRVG